MDDALFALAREARAEIVSGSLRGARLRRLLLSVPPVECDAFANALLAIPEAPNDVFDLPRGSVPYLPCGMAEILALMEVLEPAADDVFVDLGSGLGRVPILAHLLSGVRACGIEIQAPLVEAARACAGALALPPVAVRFVHGDAAEMDADGDRASIFFLYAPFNGAMLRRVLDRLEAVSRDRPVVVATVDLELRDVGWLTARTMRGALTLYDSSAPRLR